MVIITADDEKGSLTLLYESVREVVPKAQVFSFRKAIEALDFAKSNKVDVAFLDIKMREITGVELAKAIIQTNPKVNIIFVTGFTEYMPQAFDLHASGYVNKPVDAEDILKQMNNLLYPVEEKKDLYIKCFGNFELLNNGIPVEFERTKAKELLAYLVDKMGEAATRKEIAGAIFENKEYDDKIQNYFTKIYTCLRDTLTQLGAEEIMVKGRNSYYIDFSKIECDAYDYLHNKSTTQYKFRNEYMLQYSWAESSYGMFEREG